ncbi:RNA polymerase III RPC4-domain-containing protein [Melanogaster broomeanus]|nr:RNA polymerase III RPC4-domain-containing protein [Melanogaster broomeanus]
MSSQAEAGPSGGQKAIGSLAKKQSDVTRQGTQKLKFVPTLPARRKKEYALCEAPPSSVPAASERGNGRGRGRGRGRGGEGRGAAPRPPPAEMTASGPFAMGPALAGTSARRSAPRSNFAPIVPLGPTNSSALGASLSNTAAPALQKDKQRENVLVDATQTPKAESDVEEYSEPDEGVEIIDMENVRQMDWMAPETLRRERRDRKKKKSVKIESEETALPSASEIKGTDQQVDQSNALDLSESEEEEDVEDLIDDFAIQADIGEEAGIRQERLYFFQFPEPFPTFVSNAASLSEPSSAMEVDAPDQGVSTVKRRVSFAADVKSPAPTTNSTTPAEIAAEPPKEIPKIDGIIGQLEVYRSGTVKMRLDNGIVLQVSEATQPSFLQQAVHLDMENKRLHVLGEVNKRFVVSPDLDTLLIAMESADRKDASAMPLDDANLIKMDPV